MLCTDSEDVDDREAVASHAGAKAEARRQKTEAGPKPKADSKSKADPKAKTGPKPKRTKTKTTAQDRKKTTFKKDKRKNSSKIEGTAVLAW